MTLSKALSILILISVFFSCHNNTSTLRVTFKEDQKKLNETEKVLAAEIINNAETEIRELLPKLPDSIEVNIEVVDWNLEAIGGVTGRTMRNSPPLVEIQISDTYSKGITHAINTCLKETIFHEFHHLYRGWAIEDNTFDIGIPIAAVNEGLAVVFAEDYAGKTSEANDPPEEEIAEAWAKEIMALPKNANYQKWMFNHPDGREAIGYRTGNYLIRKAMLNSGKNILELGEYTPKQLLKLAGY